MSNVEKETRLFKDASYTLRNGILDRVVVIGLWAEGLDERAVTDYGLEIIRWPTVLRLLKNRPIVRRLALFYRVLALISIIQYISAVILTSRQMRPNHISCHNAILLPVCWLAAKISKSHLQYLPHELETRRSGLIGLRKKKLNN